MHSSFDLKNYTVFFQGIFEVPEFQACFHEYLKSEFNQNPLDFIIAVENIKKADKDWFKLAQEVIAKYVKPEATSEINISGKDKKKTIEAFGKLQKTATKEECYHVFDDLVDIVKLELSTDSFPRFIRSESCAAFCKKHKDNRKVLDLNRVVEFDYKDEEFIYPLVTEKDFEFIRWLANDSFDWEMICNQKGKFNAYFIPFNPFPKVKLFEHAAIMKIEAIFPFPLEHVLCSLAPIQEQRKYDTSLKYGCELEYIPAEKLKAMGKEQKSKWHSRSCVIMGSDHCYPFPLKTRRRLINCVSVRYDPSKEETIVLAKSCNPDVHRAYFDGKKHVVKSLDPAQNKNYTVYFMCITASQLYQRLDESRTLYKEVIVFDAAGWSRNTTFHRMLANDRAKRFMDSQMKHLSGPKELYTIKTRRDFLKQDSIGKVILDIEMDKVRKEYEK